jgi:regulator of replication initiation timing
MEAQQEQVAHLEAELGQARQRLDALAEENAALELRVQELQREREQQREECDRMRAVLEELRALEESEP